LDQNFSIGGFSVASRLYLFVSTRDKTIWEKCESLQTPTFRLVLSRPINDTRSFFFRDHPELAPYHMSVVNDLGDYSIETEIRELLKTGNASLRSESFVNFAHAVDNHFVAESGFWGILHHYYYSDGKSFMCSNNVFVIASLLGSRLSETSLFEYLFFNWPQNEATWFENIRMLGPGQAIVYDMDTRRLNISPRVDLYESLTEPPQDPDIGSAAETFFESVAKALAGAKAVVGLSAGSDSRTVLSGLIRFNLLDHAVSFGRADFAETRRINRLTRELGIKSVVHSLPDLLTDWEESFIRGAIITSGLINPFRVHYMKYYDRVKADAWFEGFLGSEIVKGEIAVGAVVSKCHVGIIRDNQRVADILTANFGFLPPAFRSRMEGYISDAHRAMLSSIATADGRREFASFILNNDPSKFFGPLMVLAGRRFKPYYPFLSPRIIRTLGSQFGLVGHNSLLEGYPGHIKCLIPESRMVKRLDKKIYGSRLDRLVSFREALELPMWIVFPLWGVRRLAEKLGTRYHVGQTDPRELQLHARRFVDRHPGVIDDGLFGVKIEAGHLLRERSKLICLQLIMAKSTGELIDVLTE
jgi:hypothetical protein